MSALINRTMGSAEIARVLETVITTGLYVRPHVVAGWVFAADHRGAVIAFQVRRRPGGS